MRALRGLGAVALLALAGAASAADAPMPAPEAAERALARDVFRQLIEINTTDSVGNTTTAAQAMARRLLDAGFAPADVQVLGPTERKGNLVARLRGNGRGKPILLICHLDVVEARKEDWSVDPFQFLEQDGWFYGRGTQDVKSGDAILIATLIRYKRAGFVPDRDLIVALTADEEGGAYNGVDWLLKNHRELVDAEFVVNPDSGGVDADDGRVVSVQMGATEKLYADYLVEATNPGGHSSLPRPDNAIYQMADALERLKRNPFPVELNPVTRAYFEREAQQQGGAVAADIRALLKTPADARAIARLSVDAHYNSTLRTTCVPTRLDGGHANNALPQRATANINCRILPGHSKEEVRQTLLKLFRDAQLKISYVSDAGVVSDTAPDVRQLPPPPIRRDVMQALEQTTAALWPGAAVIPEMETGASDGIYTNAAGLPTYGVSGVAIDRDDVRAHGRDERLRVSAFYAGLDFYGRFLKTLATSSVTP